MAKFRVTMADNSVVDVEADTGEAALFKAQGPKQARRALSAAPVPDAAAPAPAAAPVP